MRTQPWLEGKYFSWQRSFLFWGLIGKQVSKSLQTDIQCRKKSSNGAITHRTEWLAYVLWHSKKSSTVRALIDRCRPPWWKRTRQTWHHCMFESFLGNCCLANCHGVRVLHRQDRRTSLAGSAVGDAIDTDPQRREEMMRPLAEGTLPFLSLDLTHLKEAEQEKTCKLNTRFGSLITIQLILSKLNLLLLSTNNKIISK